MALLCLDGVVTLNRECLRDVDFLRGLLPQMVRRVGMMPVGEVIIQPYAHWEGTAPSAVLFMEESSVTVHCYPEADYIEITLHTCAPISEPGHIVQELQAVLGLDMRYHFYAPERNWRERAEAKVLLDQSK